MDQEFEVFVTVKVSGSVKWVEFNGQKVQAWSVRSEDVSVVEAGDANELFAAGVVGVMLENSGGSTVERKKAVK